MNYELKTVSEEMVYGDRITTVKKVEIELPDGRKGERVIVGRPSAATVLAITDENEVLLVRQYRKGIEKVQLELPAGMIDAGEDPARCAIRELEEETGYRTDKVEHLITIHPVPAFCDEVIYLYLAPNISKGQLCRDDDEFMTTEKIKLPVLMEMLKAGEISDAKTIIGIMIADKITKGEWAK